MGDKWFSIIFQNTPYSYKIATVKSALFAIRIIEQSGLFHTFQLPDFPPVQLQCSVCKMIRIIAPFAFGLLHTFGSIRFPPSTVQ